MISVKSIIIDRIYEKYVDVTGVRRVRKVYYKRQSKFVLRRDRWRGWLIEYKHPKQRRPWYVYILLSSDRLQKWS